MPTFCPGENVDGIIGRGGDRPLPRLASSAPFEAVIHAVVAASLADYGRMMLQGYHVSYLADAKGPARETSVVDGVVEIFP